LIDLRLGDCLDRLRGMPGGSVQTCVTSPPYFALRDYGVEGQIGLEPTPDAYVAKMVQVFAEVRRVLRDDGTCWVNLGDSYAGNGSPGGESSRTCGKPNAREKVPTKPGQAKQLLGIPWRVAFALQADGWWLRSDIIWAKPNPMPESVRDRPTKSHEYVFLLAKSDRYMYDADGVREEATQPRGLPSLVCQHKQAAIGQNQTGTLGTNYGPAGRNARTVWTITPRPFKGSHFATFPVELAERCIKAGTGERGACPACGKAWERVVERTRYKPEVVAAGVRCVDESRADKTRKLSGADYNASVRITGERWEKRCTCPAADPVPCVVLDPFSGAGTTGVACVRLGRSYIGLELNPAYLEMSRARLDAERAKAPLLEAGCQ
jgi:DNA modification methylase